MKVLVALNSFKGTASSIDAGEAVARGIRSAGTDEVRVAGIADGGEGTVDVFHRSLGGEIIETCVLGPLFEERKAKFATLPDKTAVIEMAASSGLPLVPKELRNPLNTTTYGVGQLIRAALNFGSKKIFVGIGGSATVDGGIGMAAAMGVIFTDAGGNPVPLTGRGLGRIKKIDTSGLEPMLKDAEIVVLTDVENILLGEHGAARIFGPQKGADSLAVEMLEKGMKNLAMTASSVLCRDCKEMPGAGAAGGLGYGLAEFIGASVKPGADTVFEAMKFREMLNWADVVVTGEGRLDSQSKHGKGPEIVRRLARETGKRVFAVAGSIDRATDAAASYDSALSLIEAVGEEMSFSDALGALEKAVISAWGNMLLEGGCGERHSG